MTKEEWRKSRPAPEMLLALNTLKPEFLKTLIPTLHLYFLECCLKNQHLTPQKGLRNGLLGARKWIDGEITDDELYRLDRHAEADCFAFENLGEPENLKEVQSLIDSIAEVKNMPFNDAKELLKKAAYFAEMTMVYPKINHAPFVKSLCNSQFLCAELLRKHVKIDGILE